MVSLGLLIPQLKVEGYWSYFGGLSGPVVPIPAGSLGEARQLYPTQALNLSLQWQIPLGTVTSGGEKRIYDAEIELKNIEIRQTKARANAQILAATFMLDNAREQIELATQGSADAVKAFQQSIQRQALGTVRPFEVLQAQEIFIESRLDYLNAVTNYNKSQYSLFVALGGHL